MAEWWAIFWDIFSATNRKASSPEARAYVEVRAAAVFFFALRLLHPSRVALFVPRACLLNHLLLLAYSITSNVVLHPSDAKHSRQARLRPRTQTAARPFQQDEMAFSRLRPTKYAHVCTEFAQNLLFSIAFKRVNSYLTPTKTASRSCDLVFVWRVSWAACHASTLLLLSDQFGVRISDPHFVSAFILISLELCCARFSLGLWSGLCSFNFMVSYLVVRRSLVDMLRCIDLSKFQWFQFSYSSS